MSAKTYGLLAEYRDDDFLSIGGDLLSRIDLPSLSLAVGSTNRTVLAPGVAKFSTGFGGKSRAGNYCRAKILPASEFFRNPGQPQVNPATRPSLLPDGGRA